MIWWCIFEYIFNRSFVIDPCCFGSSGGGDNDDDDDDDDDEYDDDDDDDEYEYDDECGYICIDGMLFAYCIILLQS